MRPLHTPTTRILALALVSTLLALGSGLVQPATAVELVQDGGFEATDGRGHNDSWASTDSAYGSALCHSDPSSSCGASSGNGASRTGTGWIWFGGDAAGVVVNHTATVSQSVVLPVGRAATLAYYYRNGKGVAPYDGTVVVTVDGVEVNRHLESPTDDPAYLLQTVDLSSFADGDSHLLVFSYANPVAGHTNMLVDDVSILVDDTAPETTLTSRPPGGVAKSLSVPVAFASSESPATFQCAVDGAAFATCTSPTTLSVTPGAHTFRVRAADASGNYDTTPAEAAFTAYDCTALTATVTTAQAAVTAAQAKVTSAAKALKKAKKHHQTAKVKEAKKRLRAAKRAAATARATLAATQALATPCNGG